MTRSLRSTFSYNLYFVLLALFAFWSYYQTMDSQTAAGMIGASVDSQGDITHQWMITAQSWFSDQFGPILAIPGQIRDGISSMK